MGVGNNPVISFWYWISCLRQVSILWGWKTALKICLRVDSGGAVLRIWCFTNVSQLWCRGQALTLRDKWYYWKEENKVDFFNNRILPLSLRREASEDGWAFVLVLLGKPVCGALLGNAVGVQSTWIYRQTKELMCFLGEQRAIIVSEKWLNLLICITNLLQWSKLNLKRHKIMSGFPSLIVINPEETLSKNFALQI